jgi:hypothetical protein
VIEQGFASEKKNRAIGSVAGQRRIEEALMIHRQNYRPALEHAFPVQNAKSKKDFGEQTRERISEPIVEVHEECWRENIWVTEVRAGLEDSGIFPVEAAVPAATAESMRATRLPPQMSNGMSIFESLKS